MSDDFKTKFDEFIDEILNKTKSLDEFSNFQEKCHALSDQCKKFNLYLYSAQIEFVV